MEKKTIPAPPPATLKSHDLAAAMLAAIVNDYRRVRESLAEMEAAQNEKKS